MIQRTASAIRLKSDDSLYYTVTMVDEGGGVIIPEADYTTGAAETSDAYVALIGSDGLIYRWSLQTLAPTMVLSLIDLSPDQSEPAIYGLDMQFGSQWLRVKVELQDTGSSIIPNLIVVDGSPWPKVVRGGLSTFVRHGCTVARY